MHFETILITITAVALGTEVNAHKLSSDVLDICEILPKNSIILEPNSCTNWLKCPSTPESNDYEEGSCLPELFFDKNLRKCRPQNEVSCPFHTFIGSNNDTWSNACVNKPDGTFLAKPYSCNEFIYCKNSNAKSSRCPSNLVFDPNKQSCVYADQYDCPRNKPPTPAISKHRECQLISDAIEFADRESCTTFHKCELGGIKNYTCGTNTSFDHITGRCLSYDKASCLADKENNSPMGRICGTIQNKIIGYIPDRKTCSGYYHCANIEGSVDRNPSWNKCRDGRFFDPSTLSCRDRTAVQCVHDRCEGMGNKYVNVAGDCKAYAHCKNNVKSADGKCTNGYYFDERSQGCTPQEIKYAACA